MMLTRLWRLLEGADRRRILWIVPLLVVSAGVEIVGVAAVLPFLALLADPGSVVSLPLVGPTLDAWADGDPLALLRLSGALLATFLVLANVLVMLTQWWLFSFSWSLNHRLSARLLAHYLAQPYAFALTRNTAALANKVVVEVRQLIEQGVQSGLEIVTRSAVIGGLVGFLVLLDPLLAVTVFGVLGLAYGGLFTLTRHYLGRIGRESVRAGAGRMKAVNEALGGFKELKVLGREAAAFAQYTGPSRRYGEVQAAQRALSTLPRYGLEAIAVGSMVLLAALLAGRDGAFASTLPLLGAYAFAGLRLMPAMQTLFAAVARSRFAVGSLESVESDLSSGDREHDVFAPTPPAPPFERSIVLRDVTFAYPGREEPILRGITLEIPRRRSVAIVGRTGSGKTTAVDVLLGLLEPSSGGIELDGRAVQGDDLRSYRQLFGYVPQGVFLLDDTVTRNVAFGLPDAAIDVEAVRRACELAQIASFVETELPEGYDTIVGERGIRLSGGQRQRIGVARALYGQPEVLVFDEATSALDVHTERQLYAALEHIARSHTVVTIAHRLDTVAKADLVVVLEGGRVVDQGPPDEVLARYRGEVVASS
jgi:ATP-binding cassette, subfamily B, bacterial PglK